MAASRFRPPTRLRPTITKQYLKHRVRTPVVLREKFEAGVRVPVNLAAFLRSRGLLDERGQFR